VNQTFKQIVLSGLAVIIVLSPLAAMADPPHQGGQGKGRGAAKHQHRDVYTSDRELLNQLDYQDRIRAGKRDRDNRDRSNRAVERAVLDAVQRTILLDILYGRGSQGNLLDPRLRSNIFTQSSLPPGIQKQVMRGKGLPPGIQKNMVMLPFGVNDQLGFRGRRDIQMGVLGRDVILYSVATGLVLDILRDAIR
jgi:hypothetical protein